MCIQYSLLYVASDIILFHESCLLILIKFVYRNFMQLVFSGDDSGKVLKYNPSTKETTVLVRNIQFPNGISLSKDGSFFVFCEGVIGRSVNLSSLTSIAVFYLNLMLVNPIYIPMSELMLIQG